MAEHPWGGDRHRQRDDCHDGHEQRVRVGIGQVAQDVVAVAGTGHGAFGEFGLVVQDLAPTEPCLVGEQHRSACRDEGQDRHQDDLSPAQLLACVRTHGAPSDRYGPYVASIISQKL